MPSPLSSAGHDAVAGLSGVAGFAGNMLASAFAQARPLAQLAADTVSQSIADTSRVAAGALRDARTAHGALPQQAGSSADVQVASQQLAALDAQCAETLSAITSALVTHTRPTVAAARRAAQSGNTAAVQSALAPAADALANVAAALTEALDRAAARSALKEAAGCVDALLASEMAAMDEGAKQSAAQVPAPLPYTLGWLQNLECCVRGCTAPAVVMMCNNVSGRDCQQHSSYNRSVACLQVFLHALEPFARKPAALLPLSAASTSAASAQAAAGGDTVAPADAPHEQAAREAELV